MKINEVNDYVVESAEVDPKQVRTVTMILENLETGDPIVVDMTFEEVWLMDELIKKHLKQ